MLNKENFYSYRPQTEQLVYLSFFQDSFGKEDKESTGLVGNKYGYFRTKRKRKKKLKNLFSVTSSQNKKTN